MLVTLIKRAFHLYGNIFFKIYFTEILSFCKLIVNKKEKRRIEKGKRFLSSAGNIAFSNLPVIFAVGVAIGLAKSDKGTAVLAALIGYLVMHSTINDILSINGSLAIDNLAAVGQGSTLGIQTLETGVFGGIIIGILASYLHNRYNKIELPAYFGFFGGSRFVPIITSFSAILFRCCYVLCVASIPRTDYKRR